MDSSSRPRRQPPYYRRFRRFAVAAYAVGLMLMVSTVEVEPRPHAVVRWVIAIAVCLLIIAAMGVGSARPATRCARLDFWVALVLVGIGFPALTYAFAEWVFLL